MNWFFLALIAPFLWSIVNHFDKYLLSKYFKVGGTGALIIFSSLFAVVLLPIIYVIEPHVMDVSFSGALWLILVGILTAISILLYLTALQHDDASSVVPFYQIIPVFGFVIAWILLGEHLSTHQIMASLIILAGALILSLDFSSAKMTVRRKTTLLMLLATLLIALAEAIFKFVALEESFWISSFWNHIGLVGVGIILYTGVKSYRKEFHNVFRENRGTILSINILSEVLTIIGNLIFSYATLLAPLALVMLVNSYQPLFVFIGGIMITVLFPRIAKENLSRKVMLQKVVSIVIMLIGSYILYL